MVIAVCLVIIVLDHPQSTLTPYLQYDRHSYIHIVCTLISNTLTCSGIAVVVLLLQ